MEKKAVRDVFSLLDEECGYPVSFSCGLDCGLV